VSCSLAGGSLWGNLSPLEPSFTGTISIRLGRAAGFAAQRASLVGVLSGPTGHGFSHAARRRASRRYSAQGLFARFAAPKPNARPTTPRRGASSPDWWNSASCSGVPLADLESLADGYDVIRVRECAESPAPLREEGLRRRMHSGAPPGSQRVLGDSDQRQSPAEADEAYAQANYRPTNPRDASVRGCGKRHSA
jgi:hypothetical protein